MSNYNCSLKFSTFLGSTQLCLSYYRIKLVNTTRYLFEAMGNSFSVYTNYYMW